MRTHHRTTPVSRILTTAAVSLAALFGLTACGEEPIEPKPLETLSSSPTPTTPAAPELPEVAKRHGAKGAEAFVRHYVALINHAQRTGETSALVAASASQCESCTKGVNYVRDIYDAGGIITGGEMRILQVNNNFSYAGERTVDTKVRVSPEQVDDGDKTTRRDGGASLVTFKLKRTAKGWIVSGWWAGKA